MSIEAIFRCVRESKATTAIANAFRCCFGLPQKWQRPKDNSIVSVEKASAIYEGLDDCFKNIESPMDGKHGK